MSEILCRWLNLELRISKVVEPQSLHKDFSSGYLLGEVLSRYQLQEDFQSFSRNSTANAKLNNFTRLEPTLQLLGVPFELSVAKAVMQGQPGAVTRLLYQLYVLLQKKKRSGLTGTALETMQPAATARLHRIENHIYTQRLRAVVKREADVKMQKITQRFEKKGQDMYGRSVMAELEQEEKRRHLQEERRLQDIDKLRQARKKQQEMLECIQAAAVQIPKPPVTRSLRAPRKQQQQEAQNVHQQIAQFEKNRKRLSPASYGPTSFSVQVTRAVSEEEVAQWNSDYVQKIRQRLEEDAAAREQREKRRRRALIQQLHTHHTHEEMVREEQLLARLMRQSQQEKRIAVQLMQIRQQKEVLRQNRILRQRQYAEQRLTDFHQALDREATLLQQDRVERQEEMCKEREFHAQLAAERAQAKHQKHFNICREVLEQMLDLATKSGEYRLLTANSVPLKLLREWKELYFTGKPLYEVSELESGAEPAEPTPEQAVELEKLKILNQQDYEEYTNMKGDWAWPEEEGENRAPPANNDILGHVVARLQNILNPPGPGDPSPQFPDFSLRACVLGKVCSGKTTCLARIREVHGIHILSADTLIQEALAAHQAGEQAPSDRSPGLENSAELCGSGVQDVEHGESSAAADSERVCKDLPEPDSGTEQSLQLQHGAAMEKALRRGGAVPDELLIDIFLHAIRQVPEGHGWILDGFPANVSQARLLEKALSGADPDQADRKKQNRRPSLVKDRNAAKAPPPPSPALHLAVLLEVSDEQVLDRAVHRSPEQAREENPDESDSTPPKIQEHTHQSAPPAGEHAHIQHRIAAFQDAWPRLEKWFGEKQKILVKVPAEVDEGTLLRSVETVLLNTMTTAQKGDEADSSASPAVPQTVDSPKGGTAGQSRRASIFTASTEEAPSPTPGSTGWLYVDESLPQETVEYLVPYWDTVCSSYVSNVKAVMQNLRSERHLIIHHLYNIREDFKQYLQRPDLKQEFVSAWQRDYNSVPDDMRQDEETKVELHHRLDDLRERLWDICDRRKEEAMQERAGVVGDGWLEDHTALLVNHYSTLMQVEVDRFQDTLRVLRDYYTAMYRSVLPETAPDFTCIPLLDIINNNGNQPERITRVPLIERTLPPTDPSGPLQDSYHTAVNAVTNMVSAEVQQVELEVNQEVQEQQPVEREKTQSQTSVTHSAKKKSAKKKGPPSPVQEPTPPPVVEERPQTARRRAVMRRIRKEYSRALQHEEDAVKQRLELVKLHGFSTVHSVQRRAEQAHADMQQWLDNRFTCEINSVEKLCEVVQHYIEVGLKITLELLLDCTDFFIDGETRVLSTPPPPPRPPPVERTNHSTLSVLQLHSLLAQLRKVAPTGVEQFPTAHGLVSSSELCKVLQELSSLSLGSDALPEAWTNLSDSQIQELVCMLSQGSEMVDWRRLVLSAAQPWTSPSQKQLLRTLRRFRERDTAASGVLTLQQYREVELWFSSQGDVSVPDDSTEPPPYDRLANLKEFFFTLFADSGSSPAVVDYLTMLMYFCCHADPARGFIRALSVVTQHKHQYRHSGPLLQSLVHMDGDEECEAEEDDESLCDSDGVSVDELLRVLSHGGPQTTSHHRIESNGREEIQQDLVKVFKELGFEVEEKIPFSILSQHPFLQDVMEGSSQYLLADIHRVLHIQRSDGEPSNSPAS